MNTLQVISSIAREHGGTAKFMVDYAAALSTAQVNVLLVSQEFPGTELLPVDSRVDLRLLSKNPLARNLSVSFGNLGALVSDTVSQESVDIGHVHGLWLRSCHDSVKAIRRAGIPLVISPHGMLEDWAWNYKKWKKRIAWQCYQKSDMISAEALQVCSMLEAEGLRRRGLKQPIGVVPIGVELPPEVPLEPEAVSVKKDKKIALFLSRINVKKGIPMLLRAWAALRPTDWELIIAGNDNEGYQPELEALCRDLKLEADVTFAGPVFGAKKDTLYRRADLFVLPTYSENFGIVVPEALSYGVPVLTTTGTPWAELPSAGCGWCIEPIQDEVTGALSEALQTSDSDLDEMGELGRELVKRKYQWEAIADQSKEFYEWSINGGSLPSFVV